MIMENFSRLRFRRVGEIKKIDFINKNLVLD